MFLDDLNNHPILDDFRHPFFGWYINHPILDVSYHPILDVSYHLLDVIILFLAMMKLVEKKAIVECVQD